MLCSEDGKRRLVLRKTFPALKKSVYPLIKEILDDWGVQYTEHKTDKYFKVHDNYLFYDALDDPEKIKSASYADIWLEEATDFTEEDFKQLTIRLDRSKDAGKTTLLLTFNPISADHWLIKYMQTCDHRKVLVHHSTYRMNFRNLSPDFIEQLRSYEKLDPNFYRVYTLGQPGVIEGKVYNHFRFEDSDTWPWEKLYRSLHMYGLDFGFNDQMALCEVWYYEKEFYIRELYYRSGTTTDDLAIWMHTHGISHSDMIYADSAEPDRILTLNTSRQIRTKYFETGEEVDVYLPRFNVFPAKKDIKAGIDFIKSRVVHCSSDSLNIIKEYNNYKYKQRSDGSVIDEPVDAFNHLLDACRYSCFSVNLQTNVKTSRKIGFSFATNRGLDPFSGL
jgi:phage terminase large subunit